MTKIISDVSYTRTRNTPAPPVEAELKTREQNRVNFTESVFFFFGIAIPTDITTSSQYAVLLFRSYWISSGFLAVARAKPRGENEIR